MNLYALWNSQKPLFYQAHWSVKVEKLKGILGISRTRSISQRLVPGTVMIHGFSLSRSQGSRGTCLSSIANCTSHSLSLFLNRPGLPNASPYEKRRGSLFHLSPVICRVPSRKRASLTSCSEVKEAPWKSACSVENRSEKILCSLHLQDHRLSQLVPRLSFAAKKLCWDAFGWTLRRASIYCFGQIIIYLFETSFIVIHT